MPEEAMSVTKIHDVEKCVECPLCMESLDFDDIGFFPCSCGYQVCRFCWHRLKNDENGLCPACRQTYPESPAGFTSISIEAVEELKKRKKKQKEKQKLKDVAKSQNLAQIRVVQKNLLFVIGLPSRLTQDDLRREFSKYGRIIKLVVNTSVSYVTAYVTYSRPEDAVSAIKSLNDGGSISGKTNGTRSTTPTLRASLGTTKYCTHWLRCQTCPKLPECMYLHELADPEASFTKEEMQIGKHNEYEKRLIQHYLSLIHDRKDKDKKKEDNGQNGHNHPQTPINKKKNGTKIVDMVFVNGHHQNHDDDTSNDSMNGDPKKTFNNHLNTSNHSWSSSSLSTTPNSDPQMITINHQTLMNAIDDNAIDATDDVIAEDADRSGDDVTIDDDDLDFDPISISTTGLQDLLKDSSNEEYNVKSSYSNGYGNHVNNHHQIGHQNNVQTHVWQNSLRQMLPNVNITFQHGSGSTVPSLFNSFQNQPNQFMRINGVVPSAVQASGAPIQQFWNSRMDSQQTPSQEMFMQQQMHQLRLQMQQRQSHHYIQRNQFPNQMYQSPQLGTVGSMSLHMTNRQPPPPGF